MPPSLEVRRVAFARFVERALHDAKVTRGWNQRRVIEESGVGRTTLFRWLKGNWVEDPEAAKVRDFCDALDIPPAIPFLILWPGKRNRVEQPEPSPMDPDVERVLRKLADPNVPDVEKYLIRETIRSLAARPSRPGSQTS
ncbi:transcriptional regulator [Micromonospora sp. NBC_01655]|uniref:transcriptional regulator n=1 Tax=Micromonospora sp. NBC_01655 TaxID=2975983 RepID=UPI0022531B4E|nr:transcriptional regulator [Micromonospora sp. NBC_01655]MCX4468945.1 transcriptional regulator [Micromonospora sp. NBC_01655]